MRMSASTPVAGATASLMNTVVQMFISAVFIDNSLMLTPPANRATGTRFWTKSFKKVSITPLAS